MIPALPVRLRSRLVLLLASVAGLAVFVWPLLISPGAAVAGQSADAPLVFLFTLPVLVLIVLTELGSGGIDAKALALLGEDEDLRANDPPRLARLAELARPPAER